MTYLRSLIAQAAVATIVAGTPAFAAVTVGNPVVAATSVDSCQVCTFVVNQAFGVAGLNVSNFTFYANNASSITPLLLTRTDSGTQATFTVVGVGLQQSAALGPNTFGFNLAQGTDVTATNSYFGFAYNNGGVVAFNYTDGSGSGTFVGPDGDSGALGSTFTVNATPQITNSFSALDARTYSIQATAVPEPATWALMLLGFGLVGLAMRKRSNVRTTVSYA